MNDTNEEENDLNKYAKLAKKEIMFNNYLHKKLKYLNDYTKLIKVTINDCLSNKNKNLLSKLDNIKNHIKKDNTNFQKEYEQLHTKYNFLLNNCVNEIPMGKPILLEEKNNNFCLNFIKSENNYIIKGLNKSIKQSKNHTLTQEQTRESLVDINKCDKDVEKYTTYFQNYMLFEFKKYNKLNEKIIKYNKQKLAITNNISLLNKYISNNRNKKAIINFNQEQNIKPQNKIKKISFIKKTLQSVRLPKHKKIKEKIETSLNENNSDEEMNKMKRKSKNNIINKFQKINDLFNTSIKDINLEEELYDEEDYGIYENNFKNRIQLSTKYLKHINDSLPQLKLGLIKYNQTTNPEIDVYSLQRRKFLHKSLPNQIKEMEKKIEKTKTILNNLKDKVKELERLNTQINDNYHSIKIMVNQNNTISNMESDFIIKSLNKEGEVNKEVEITDEFDKMKNNFDNFLDNINEVEEEYIDGHDNEKSDEKDTKDTRKEDENEKSNNLKNNINITKKFVNKINIKENKSAFKPFKKKSINLKRNKSK